MNGLEGKKCHYCGKDAEGKQSSTGNYICIDCLYVDENNKPNRTEKEVSEEIEKTEKEIEELENELGVDETGYKEEIDKEIVIEEVGEITKEQFNKLKQNDKPTLKDFF